MTRSRWLGTAAAMVASGLLAAGCGSSSSSTTTGGGGSSGGATSATSAATTTAAAGSAAFGAPKKATGSPYVFGMINDETGAVTFPEARQGAIAAMEYVNNYLGGINGHPIVIDNCIGDGTPAGAGRCATELVAKHPLAILGAADVGAPASIPIYAHANLAYIGGIPFTPVPFVSPNSIQFWSVSVGDNAAAAVYAGKTLGAKSVALMYFSNPQGESIIPQIVPVFKAAGVSTVKTIPLSPTSPDPSPQAALIQSSGADLAYIDVPNGCGNVLKSLKSVGYTGKLMGIDPCGAPPVITASAGGAEGMYIASPFILPTGTSQQAQLFQAAMKKWAAPGTLIDSPSVAGFATVMNVQAALSKISGTPDTKSIMAAFKTGSDHPNFLSHPYTCDGQQMTGAPAICNDYYLMNQVKNGQLTQPNTTDWTTSKGYYKGQGL
ncbi:MAG TPA: ABC transporter substrate-binding protein [Solirubrobacteraceae bacterium]|nr:ABC transporter substrate-binding protein [Solirubrobacteraceae bacterium]